MALHRRRHPSNLLVRCILPSITATSAALLFFLALYSFSSPPPLLIGLRDIHHFQFHTLNNAIVVRKNLAKDDMFDVPMDGLSSSDEFWRLKLARFFYGCSSSSKNFTTADVNTQPDRYFSVATNGGLNQQRTGITDAVVAARILNATLVVPKMDQKSFWKDKSNFSDIFDVDWFISYLAKDVKIIKELPLYRGKAMNPRTMRLPKKCSVRCYEKTVLPVLLKRRAVHIKKFDYRLSNRLEKDWQKLRCRVNYHALKFVDPIREMGKKLVLRMRMRSRHFIALHLRFEPDMLAFSGCYYGGGDKERNELSAIRRRWKALHASNPESNRRHGKCPLTPKEVGLLLRALGFGSEVHIYVASGEVYGGEETMKPLKQLFPYLHSKETLATKEELAPFSSFSSRMAALDFIVCDDSDVFATNNNGNMARILAGRRRYFGHKPTIRPNAKKLSSLFLNQTNITWNYFVERVQAYQIGFTGEPNELKPGKGDFHENPSPCICEDSEVIEKYDMSSDYNIKSGHDVENWISKNTSRNGTTDDDETEWPNMDFEKIPNLHQALENSDYTLFDKPDEQVVLDELLSD